MPGRPRPRWTASLLLLPVELADDVLDSLAGRDRGVFTKRQPGPVLEPYLVTQHRSQVRPGVMQRLGRRFVLLCRAEHGILDGGLPKIWADLDAGQRDEAQPGVGQPLELLGER